MAQTFRTSKIEKYIAKKVEFMEMQQKTIEVLKEKGVDREIIIVLEASQTTTKNIVAELCREFNFEMPIVEGVK